MRSCTKRGGSWTGKPYDTECAHDFGEAPEPQGVQLLAPDTHGGYQCGRLDRHLSVGERYWYAYGDGPDGKGVRALHPTEAGAISLWKKEWRRRRDAPLWPALATAHLVKTAARKYAEHHGLPATEHADLRELRAQGMVDLPLTPWCPTPDAPWIPKVGERVLWGGEQWTVTSVSRLRSTARIDRTGRDGGWCRFDALQPLPPEQDSAPIDEGLPTRVEVAESKADLAALLTISCCASQRLTAIAAYDGYAHTCCDNCGQRIAIKVG